MRRTIPVLTRDNCFLVVLHSMNIRLMLDKLKSREGRQGRCSRKWVIFVSPQQWKKNEHGWVIDKGILKGHMYVVAYIVRFERVVGLYKWDWVLEVHGLETPVLCPPVGLCNTVPTVKHDAAMRALNNQLSAMQMTRVWSFQDEAACFASGDGGLTRIPLDMVQCYVSVKHEKWDIPMETGQVVWYSLLAREDPDMWNAKDGANRVQVQVLGHVFVTCNPVRIFIS